MQRCPTLGLSGSCWKWHDTMTKTTSQQESLRCISLASSTSPSTCQAKPFTLSAQAAGCIWNFLRLCSRASSDSDVFLTFERFLPQRLNLSLALCSAYIIYLWRMTSAFRRLHRRLETFPSKTLARWGLPVHGARRVHLASSPPRAWRALASTQRTIDAATVGQVMVGVSADAKRMCELKTTSCSTQISKKCQVVQNVLHG